MANKEAAGPTAASTKGQQHQDQLNTQSFNWQLLSLRHARSLRIATKLSHFADTADVAADLRGCSPTILYGQSGPNEPPIIESVYHCHRSMCQVCRGERQQTWQNKIGQLISRDMQYMIDGNRNTYSEEQIRRWDNRIERLEHRVGVSRDPEFHNAMLPGIFKLYDKREGAGTGGKKTLYPFLITMTIKNPDHIWTGERTFCHVWEKDWIPEPDRLRSEISDLDEQIAEKRSTVRILYRRRGVGLQKSLLEALEKHRARLAAQLEAADNPNQLEELLWKPWRKAREDARVHPDRKWGRTWNHIFGGLWVTEVTFNNKARTFHPHIHMLVVADVPYLANQRRDKDEHTEGDKLWQELLQPFFSRQMDVRIDPISAEQWAKSPESVVREVTKYLTKPEKTKDGMTIKESYIPDWAYREIVKAEAGRRLINTFGTWRTPEPAWDPNAGTAPKEPIEDGYHFIRQWNKKTRRYDVTYFFPTTAEFPILGAAERLAKWGAEAHHMVQVAISHITGKVVDIGYGQAYAADGVKKWDRDDITAAKRRYLIRTDPTGAEASGVSIREINNALRVDKP